MSTPEELRQEYNDEYKAKGDNEAIIRGLLKCPNLAVPFCGRCRVLKMDNDCHIKDGLIRDLMCIKIGRPSVPWKKGLQQLKMVNAELKTAIDLLKQEGKTGAKV
jgi:hypothetical protein